jgi:AcrR family transcriptional regulator
VDARKREAIYDAAAEVFSRHGFKQASIDEVARRARVAKGTVYLACRSKEDLFYEAVRRRLDAWSQELSRRLDRPMPPDALLERASVEALGYMDENPLVLDLFLGLYHTELPDWADRFEALRALGQSRVEAILRAGVQGGHFRGGLDVEETASVLLDMQVAIYVWRRRTRAGPRTVRQRQAAALALALDGLRR